MNTTTTHALLLAVAIGISLPAVHAFDESPAFPERLLPGGLGRQRALPEHFAGVGSLAWVQEKPMVANKVGDLIEPSREAWPVLVD